MISNGLYADATSKRFCYIYIRSVSGWSQKWRVFVWKNASKKVPNM